MVIQQEWFTVDEAAEYLRVSRRSIYKLCQEGDLEAYRTADSGHRRFRKEDLDSVMKKNTPESETDALLVLTAAADPVLAELWDNDMDAAYDRL